MFDREEYRLDTTINEFGRFIWDFTLYCAGRRTYSPSICEDVIRRNAEVILFPWRAHIISHVMGAFAESFNDRIAADREYRKAKEAGDPNAWEKAYKGGSLGMDFDEDGWMKAVTYLAKHDQVDPALVNACWDGEDAPITVTFSDVDDFWFMVGAAIRYDYAQDKDAIFSAKELTAFIKGHADDLNPKWVSNFYRDITDDTFEAYLSNGNDVRHAWEELRKFLVDVSTPESYEPYAKKMLSDAE